MKLYRLSWYLSKGERRELYFTDMAKLKQYVAKLEQARATLQLDPDVAIPVWAEIRVEND